MAAMFARAALAATATIATASASAAIVAARAAFFPHFDVGHLAAAELVAGELFDDIDIFVVA